MLKRRTKSLFISSSPRAKSHAETAAAAASSPTKMNESKQGEKEKAARVRGEVPNISFSVCQQKRLSSISLRKVRGSPHHLLETSFFCRPKAPTCSSRSNFCRRSCILRCSCRLRCRRAARAASLAAAWRRAASAAIRARRRAAVRISRT